MQAAELIRIVGQAGGHLEPDGDRWAMATVAQREL